MAWRILSLEREREAVRERDASAHCTKEDVVSEGR